ncbi:MAG: peptidylprolyl isomerase [Candidatus Bathyarchaeota archaeon]|nr:MAG: peptidylprolyl isomerase [Candidatus Bathyarchaeota archaeon]
MTPSSGNPKIVIRTPLGDVRVEIFKEKAPITSENFLRYVDDKLYDGTSFFRTVTMGNQPNSEVKIEVVQGGTVPRDRAYPSTYPPIEHETTERTGLRHVDGAVSMARMEPGSATSSFFICIGDQPELDFGGRRNLDGKGFAAFGMVVEGMDVVRAIQRQPHEGQRLMPPVEISSISRVN